jgi:hypothetical protein
MLAIPDSSASLRGGSSGAGECGLAAAEESCTGLAAAAGAIRPGMGTTGSSGSAGTTGSSSSGKTVPVSLTSVLPRRWSSAPPPQGRAIPSAAAVDSYFCKYTPMESNRASE